MILDQVFYRLDLFHFFDNLHYKSIMMVADDQDHRFLCNYICMGVAHICTRHNNTTHFIEIIGGAQLVAGAVCSRYLWRLLKPTLIS